MKIKNKVFEPKGNTIDELVISLLTAGIPEISKPIAQPSLISLRVFEYVCGLKKDQIAGFMFHAKQNKFDNLTIDQWQEKVKQFNNKVVV